MPQFILNTPPSRRDVELGFKIMGKRRAVHPFYDLDEFAQGYVEAMFFTNGDIGDETRPDRLNRMGVSRLTRDTVEIIKGDCDRFQVENEPLLGAALCLEPGAEGLEHAREALNDRRLGQLFWFARQGHGVAFTDGGYADCLRDLQKAARAFGECYVEAWRGWIHVR